jgi:predicted enzyme related to lactoylglutathione lyase
MAVLRIVANLAAADPARARAFYVGVFGLDVLMDHGWIVTLGSDSEMTTQVSLASEGGSGTPVPSLSIEVDDLEEVQRRAVQSGAEIVYGPVKEPWGARRFFLRDPFGNIVNVLRHA